MTVGLLLSLAGLALVDSTSIGTLGIPIFLLLGSARPPVARVLVYLGTVAACYFLLGIGLMFGLSTVLDAVGDTLDGPVGYWIELVVGVGLFLLSFRFDPKRRKQTGEPRWWGRLSGGPGAMVTLGLLASLIEAASMVPYLAAIGMMTNANLAVGQWLPVLAGYVLIMILPALVLLGVRLLAGERLQRPLERLGAWIKKHAVGALGWILAIVGFLLARDGAYHLFFRD